MRALTFKEALMVRKGNPEFNPDQLRNEDGTWSGGGSSSVTDVRSSLRGVGLRYFYSSKLNDGGVEIGASSHRDEFGNPITGIGHEDATGIAFRVYPGRKHVRLIEMNSRVRGMGTKMVDTLVAYYKGYTFSVIDLARQEGATGTTFWDKMKARHPSLQVEKRSLHEHR